ncbi:MAG: hypothetical protein H5T84_09685 [Thermoleophilia bacterium]|nr:hypothetical protein [Thermoleophilia bacterium]
MGILFEIELDGFKAGKLGEPFSNNPYTFAKVGVSQELFDDEFRPQLDAWWRGWRKSQSILTRGQKAHNGGAHRQHE